MSNVLKCKEILKHLDNKETKIEEKEDFKGSYYSYINDTIYLAGNDRVTKNKEEDLVVLCHECIHSVQNKVLHAINFYSSNVEILLSVAVIILLVLKVKFVKYLLTPYFIVLILNVVVRFLLERDAVKKSFGLAKKLITNKDYEIKKIDKMQKEVKTKQIFFYLSLFWKKLIKLTIILILICL